VLTFSHKLALFETTLADAGQLVARVTAADLPRSTPCDGWDLAALLTHMIGQNNGFATAVADGNASPATYLGPDVRRESHVLAWKASATRLREAFTEAKPEGVVHLAEFDADVAAADALGMQLLDTAVHAWDVATSLGETYRPDETVIAFVLESARLIAARPDGSPGVFATPLPETGADPWSDALRLLGRKPESPALNYDGVRFEERS
jgi:uncharacterized protein (TIGR03086 family)